MSMHATSEALQTPKALRTVIGLFGRRNVGKSSVLNALAGHKASIVSPYPGTTTDPVEQAMEMPQIGPALIIDTAGIDDGDDVGLLRVKRTEEEYCRCDVGVLVTAAGEWGAEESRVWDCLVSRLIPGIIVLNKMDDFTRREASMAFDDDAMPSARSAAFDADALLAAAMRCLPEHIGQPPVVAMTAPFREGADALVSAIAAAAGSEQKEPSLTGGLLSPGSIAVLVMPIDEAAPKGRLILPQVQVIRDLIDHGCQALCVKDSELPRALASLAAPPHLVITDSQVFGKVSRIVPPDVPLTSFSLLFARQKGDLPTLLRGARAIDALHGESRVLVVESCTHCPTANDIGTVKIPHALASRCGKREAAEPSFTFLRGKGFPCIDELSSFDLVIHCGGCMLNRRSMMARIESCTAAEVPITNYGMALAFCSNILENSIGMFPECRRTPMA